VAPVSGYIVAIFGWTTGSGATGTLRLYDEANNVMFSRGYGSGVKLTESTTISPMMPLPNPIFISKGQLLRITNLATNSTSQTLRSYVVDTNARLVCIGGDTACYRTHRTDGGSWTDTDTERLAFGIVYGAIDDGTGPGPANWSPQGQVVGMPPPIILPG
jgi:hypothetical protein